MRELLVRHVRSGVADCIDADQDSCYGDRCCSDPDDRARCIARREGACSEGGGRDPQIPSSFVQSECESAPARAGEVDLHHDGHRPSQTLVDAEQEIRDDDEPPRHGKPDQDGHRQCDQPADHEQSFAADALGEVASGEIGERLGGTERHDEGKNRGAGPQPEVVLADQRQHAPLKAHHAADERVQSDQKRELPPVRPQPQPDGFAHAGVVTPPARLAATMDA